MIINSVVKKMNKRYLFPIELNIFGFISIHQGAQLNVNISFSLYNIWIRVHQRYSLQTMCKNNKSK